MGRAGITRRSVLTAFIAFAARADERTEILEILEPLPAALSESRHEDFMVAFADDMPGRADLQSRIAALIAFAEVTSSVALVRVQNGRAELDWYIEIRARATGSVVERRRDKIIIKVQDKKIREFGPIEFFRMPVVR